MLKYKRKDFIKLPEDTIYSRIYENEGLLSGLFCKISSPEYGNDWVEQDLISERGFPNDITDGSDAIEYQFNLRDSFKEFRTDLSCAGRDGCFDDNDEFVVWDKEDVKKLSDYLIEVLKNKN